MDSIKLQAGKKYKTRNGRITGELIYKKGLFGYDFLDPSKIDSYGQMECYKEDGFCISHRVETVHDIIEEA